MASDLSSANASTTRAKGRIPRFLMAERLVKEADKLGEFPSSKEAYGNLVHIALPSVAEMVLMSLTGSVDSIMIRGLGPAAIAAVGLTDQPRMLFMSVFYALNIGVTAIVARRKGQDDRADANHTLRNGLVLLLMLSVVMMTLSLILAHPLLWAVGAQEDTIGYATDYFRVLMMAMPVNALTMCICAAQRGIGNTRVTLVVNLTANLVNIAFDSVLINGHLGFPALGVLGDAIATDIGFVVGLGLAIYSITWHRKQDSFLIISPRDDWRIKKSIVKGLTKIGGNAMLEQIASRVGFMAYAVIVANMGTLVFAAHQVGLRFLNLTFTFGDGLGVAGTELVGQMLGRKRADLAQMYGKISQRIALCVSLTLFGFIIGFRYPLVRIFTTDPYVISLAASVMIVLAIIQPFQTTSAVISSCLRGAGDTRYVALVMYITVVAIRPILSFIAVYWLKIGLIGAWCGTLTDMAVRMTLMYTRFNKGKWFTIKV